MNIFKNLWHLAKSGFLPKKKRNLKETIFLGLKLYLILMLLKLICLGISSFLDYCDIFKIPSHIGGEKLREFSLIIQFTIVAIVAPIMEELAYRIGLIFSKRNLTITVIGITYYILRYTSEFGRIYCIMIAFAIGLILYLSLNQKMIELLSDFWKNNRIKVFYGLIFIFAFIHLVNYDITPELILFSFIVVLPRIVAGFIYSYARLSSGIFLAIFVHSLNNGLPILILMIAQ